MSRLSCRAPVLVVFLLTTICWLSLDSWFRDRESPPESQGLPPGAGTGLPLRTSSTNHSSRVMADTRRGGPGSIAIEPARESTAMAGGSSGGVTDPVPDDLREATAAPDVHGRDFPVPRSFASDPVPLYLRRYLRTEETAGPREPARELAHLAPVDPRVGRVDPGEERILEEAMRKFSDAVQASSSRDAESTEYAEYWAAAILRSDEYLRTALGWERFNLLSAPDLEMGELPDGSPK